MKISLSILIALLISVTVKAQALTHENVLFRIDRISEMYLGYPYIIDPLGEGQGYDNDPLFRFDGFDCVTYVETVLALSLSRNQSDFQNKITKIRYKNGHVNFVLRNHFTSIDWNKNNEKNGILIDVTKRLYKNYSQTSETVIDKSAWFKKVHKMDIKIPQKLSKVDYVPLSFILQKPELLKRIQSGSIINIVRPNWQLADKLGTNLDISHQGFAIVKDDGILYFRNASSTEKKVIEIPLLDYLKKMKNVKSIGGINILQIRN
jgi:hypothetical protein